MKKQLILYGLALAGLAFVLELIQFIYLIRLFPVETYIVLIAILFTLLGVWMGKKLTTGENQVTEVFQQNKKAIGALGITDRELEILELLAEGYSNRQIADRLYISIHTVKSHVSNLYSKLDVSRRTRAVSKAKSLRLIP